MLSRHLKKPLVAAVRRLLRPIVRESIGAGITYPVFARMLKELFVEVAEEDFALPFKRQTDSRLAVVTGLSRKEISQTRGGRAPARSSAPVEESTVTHVIGRWMAGPPYATPDGIAR